MKPLTQIALGTLIELEHTRDRKLAAKIARDHIREIPDYYSRLIAVETSAKARPNPMAHYHSVRLHGPQNFARFAYRKGLLGPGIDVVFGFHKGGSSRIQSIRFERRRWSIARVRAWLARHPMFRPYELEPARENPTFAQMTQSDPGLRSAKEMAAISMHISKVLFNRERDLVKREMSAIIRTYGDRLESVPQFLTSSSAKVIHSAEAAKRTGGRVVGYLNVVLYHSPADRAALSFAKKYPELIAPLIKNIRAAAAQREEWKAFASYRPEVLASFVNGIESFPEKPRPGTPLPDTLNRVKPLSLCPWASPICRSVCLNTSGHGKFEGMEGIAASKMVRQAKKAGIVPGDTATDDFKRFFLAGHQAHYGGETNTATSGRCRRTHAMWIAWATEGVLKNSYNDAVYKSALLFKAKADEARMPMALRLNGTSDIPVHTLQLTDGRYLLDALGEAGIVCYDYTKDYARFRRWMEADAWRTKRKTAGFPGNYYLSFSWSETNGRLALEALRRGGNVIMVFRRSVSAVGEELYPKKTYREVKKGLAKLPDFIRVGQFSDDPDDRTWEAQVIDGDATDLRFADPHNVGTKNGGMVVGLVAKGKATTPYTDNLQREAFRHFVAPVELKRIAGKLFAEVRTNPAGAAAQDAMPDAEGDIVRQSTSVIDGWAVGTTAMGT